LIDGLDQRHENEEGCADRYGQTQEDEPFRILQSAQKEIVVCRKAQMSVAKGLPWDEPKEKRIK
jgi:hypothetical protein